MAKASVSTLLFTLVLAGSPAVGEDAHLVSLADVAARMHEAAPFAPQASVMETPAATALSQEERDELRRRADALLRDPRATGLPGALEGALGFNGGFAFVTLVAFAIAND